MEIIFRQIFMGVYSGPWFLLVDEAGKRRDSERFVVIYIVVFDLYCEGFFFVSLV